MNNDAANTTNSLYSYGSALASPLTKTDRDLELEYLVKEMVARKNVRVSEESELYRRNLWVTTYDRVNANTSQNSDALATSAANKALAAYDSKFGSK